MANFIFTPTTSAPIDPDPTPVVPPEGLPVTPPSGPHGGSVSIEVQTFPTVVAPAPVFLTATGHGGFASNEGTGNVYEGPFHEVYHYWAIRGEPLSNSTRLQNFLAEWNNANFATGPNVMFM
ncbi:MAG: hypothetical protein AAGB07_07080, partial [Pseudomonadota bacterium]